MQAIVKTIPTMLLPIGDDNRDRHTTPIVNYLLILTNVLVFIFLQDWGQSGEFLYAYSTVPAEILTGTDLVTPPTIVEDQYTGQRFSIPGLQPTGIPVYLTLFSSMFMHGSLAHLGGNMLYLWICGDNLEDRMGHMRYLVFYLVCGVLAGLSHVFSSYFFGQNLYIPSLGASGAISGVLAGYWVLFPRRHIHIWLFFFFTISVPAFIAVGLWFVFQLISGLGVLGSEEGGVAYAAHIGGFIAGLILVKGFSPRRKVSIEERKVFW